MKLGRVQPNFLVIPMLIVLTKERISKIIRGEFQRIHFALGF